MRHAVLRVTLAVMVMVSIFLLSHQPGDLFAPYYFRWADKLAHLMVYGVLCGTLIYAFPRHYRCSGNRAVVVSVSISLCLIYGISDEFHQSFIPGRHPSISDLAADVIGALMACILWIWLSKTEHTGRLANRSVK